MKHKRWYCYMTRNGITVLQAKTGQWQSAKYRQVVIAPNREIAGQVFKTDLKLIYGIIV